MQKRLILYDLDGTLVDTRADIAAAVNETLRQLGHPPLPQDEIIRHVGLGVRHLLRHCVAIDDPVVIERAAAIYHAYYAEHLADRSRLCPSVAETLEAFAARRQAVLTNKPQAHSQRLLELLGVAPRFVAVIGGEAGHPSKPDPAGLNALLRQEGLEPAAALLIGDSLVDIETGRRAGVFTAVVANGFTPVDELRAAMPDLMVADLAGVVAHVLGKGW